MDMEPPYKTSLYINNLCPTHSPEKNLAWGGLKVGRFKGTYNLEEVEQWAIGRSWKCLKHSPADHPLPKQNKHLGINSY